MYSDRIFLATALLLLDILWDKGQPDGKKQSSDK